MDLVVMGAIDGVHHLCAQLRRLLVRDTANRSDVLDQRRIPQYSVLTLTPSDVLAKEHDDVLEVVHKGER